MMEYFLRVKADDSYAKLVEAAKAFMTIENGVSNEYWDLDGNPDRKLIDMFRQALADVVEE